jgi:hypothetical protein
LNFHPGLRLTSKSRWWTLYGEEVLESNFDKLEERIGAAEMAIAERSSQAGDVSARERLELQDALNALQVLREEQKQYGKNVGRNQ